jgi:hypothetical protein
MSAIHDQILGQFFEICFDGVDSHGGKMILPMRSGGDATNSANEPLLPERTRRGFAGTRVVVLLTGLIELSARQG